MKKPRLTKYGKPARSKYRKLNIGGAGRRDEHRVVMERALGRQLTRREIVHHVNGDKYDNRLENLVVMTLAEHGRHHFLGCNAIGAKLTDQAVREIRASSLDRLTLAAQFRVSKHTVTDIRSGRTWKHVL